MPKTNAEKCREYRQRQKEKNMKKKAKFRNVADTRKVAKSSTERVREFRARRRTLNVLLNNASTVQNHEYDHHGLQKYVINNVQESTLIGHNSKSYDSKYPNIFVYPLLLLIEVIYNNKINVVLDGYN